VKERESENGKREREIRLSFVCCSLPPSVEKLLFQGQNREIQKKNVGTFFTQRSPHAKFLFSPLTL